MPIYEYRCRDCETRFEALRPMGDDGRDLRCPECDAPAPERKLSTFAACGGGKSGGAPSGFG